MATLVWDQVGERVYQSGVSRGVLYLHDGTVEPWNGLIDIEESENAERKSFYLDGVKFLENLTPSDFEGKLRAFTYPDAFDSVNGVVSLAPGLEYHEQPPKSFNLSYQTMIGNDVEGLSLGYKIHILYNVIAKPEGHTYSSLSEVAQAAEFSWTLTGTPPIVKKYRPTVHLTIDSRTTPPEILALLEAQLYGTAKTNPSLPSIQDVGEYFGFRGALLIIDHGDGTWTAFDEADNYITMEDTTTFRIDYADATYLDPVTYTISSTNVDEV